MEICVRSIGGERQLSRACHGTGQSLERIVRRCSGQVKPSWLEYKLWFAPGIGRLVKHVNVRTLRFSGGELGIPNSMSRGYPSRLRPSQPLFFMPWIAWSLFFLNRRNRLSLLSHYRVVKGPGFGWTYPTWSFDCITWLDKLVCQSWLLFVSLSADLDISVNVRWTVGTYLLHTHVCRYCLFERNK
jgi:hypothetical protein